MSDKVESTTGTTKFLGPFQILDETDEEIVKKAEDDMTKNTDTLSYEEKDASGENTIVEKDAPQSETEGNNLIQQNVKEGKTTSEKQIPDEKISCGVKTEKKDIGEESTIIEKESETEKTPKCENEYHNLKQQNPQVENECENQSPEETTSCEDKTGEKDIDEENSIVGKESDIKDAPKSETEPNNFIQQNPQEDSEYEKQSPEETSCEDKTEKKDTSEENLIVEKELEVKEAPKSESEHNNLIQENSKEEKTSCEIEKQSPEENISCEENSENVIDNNLEDTDLKCSDRELPKDHSINPEETNINQPFVEEVKEDDPTHVPQEDEKSVKSCHTEEAKEDSISVSHDDEISVRSCQDDHIIDLCEDSDVAISENVDDCDKDEEDKEEPMNCHPYSFVIENYELTKEQKIQTKIGPPKSLRETPVRMVNSRIGLLKLLPVLNSAKEIAFRMQIDNNHFETTIELLAISTRDTDYIIDVGKLNKELLLLTEIFINPKIVKIIYGSERVLTTLQNILHLYVINIFDCERAGKALQTGFKSIDRILQKEYSYRFVNGMRQVDCRSRPISSQFQDYCRAVPHYLIYIYHDYKNRLLSQDEKLYKELMDEFREASKVIYPSFRQTQFLSVEEELQNRHKCQLEVLEKLNEWRNDTALRLNKGPAAIIPKTKLITLSSTLPVTEFSVCCICNSPSVKDDVEKILLIIREAKRKHHLEELPISYSKKRKEDLKDFLKKELDICTSNLNAYKNVSNTFGKSKFQQITKLANINRDKRPNPRQRKKQRLNTLPQKFQQNTNYKTVNHDNSPGTNYFKQTAPVRYSSQKSGAQRGRSSGAFKRKISQTDEQYNSRKKRK